MDKPSFEEALRALAARQRAGEHPAPEELLAYRAGDLTAEEDDRIQEHLTECRECARLLLDLAEFEQIPPPPEELGPVDARAEASWQRFRSRLQEEGEEVRGVGAQREAVEPRAGRLEEEAAAPEMREMRELRPRPVPVPVWRKPALPWALAAGLALCVLGLGLRIGTLQSQVGELSEPQLNVPLEDLPLDSETTRGVDTPEIPILPGGGVLVLTPSEEAALYEVEVAPAAGGTPEIALQDAADRGVLTLRIPPSRLAPGQYSVHLYGLENGERRPLGTGAFEISPAAP